MPRQGSPQTRRRAAVPEWACAVPRGFETVAAEEVRDRLEVAEVKTAPAEVSFATDEPFDPLVLRCVALCFRRVVSIPSALGDRAGPRELLPQARRAVPAILAAAGESRGAKLGRLRTLRVVTRMEAGYPYPRQHLKEKCERELPPLLGRHYSLVEEGAGLELWVTAGARRLTLDVRVSPEEHRSRAYKQEHVPGSLRPAAAACCVRYARPEEGEVFCDPFCGAGTIALERASYGCMYAAILAGDLDARAVSVSTVNFGPRHQPRLVARWDARQLPLPARSVDVVVTNPPFGVKSPAADPAQLYTEAAAEIARVLKRGGRAVFIAADRDLVSSATKETKAYRPDGLLNVELQGRAATVTRYVRR